MIFINPQTRKELECADPRLKEVFGEKHESFVCLPFGKPIERVLPKPIGRKIKGVCVARMGGLGDLIMLSSGLRELKKRMGDEPLIFATLPQYIPFMKAMKFIDKVIPVSELAKHRFGKLIDLRFAVEPSQLGAQCKSTWESYTMDDRSDAFDKLLGVYPCPKRFEVPVFPYKGNGLPTHHALIVASMVAQARSIPVKYIKPLCSLISRKLALEVVLIGESQPWNKELKDLKMVGVTNLIDKTGLGEMIHLCSMAELVISPDTGPLHVAGALGKKTLGIFGAIHPRTRICYYPRARSIYPHGLLPCIPCWDLHPCLKAKRIPDCMAMITPELIVDTAKELVV